MQAGLTISRLRTAGAAPTCAGGKQYARMKKGEHNRCLRRPTSLHRATRGGRRPPQPRVPRRWLALFSARRAADSARPSPNHPGSACFGTSLIGNLPVPQLLVKHPEPDLLPSRRFPGRQRYYGHRNGRARPLDTSPSQHDRDLLGPFLLHHGLVQNDGHESQHSDGKGCWTRRKME